MNVAKFVASLSLLVILFCYPAYSQSDSTLSKPSAAAVKAPTPATNVKAVDTPDDAGNAIDLSWTLSVDDNSLVSKYQVMRSFSHGAKFARVGETTRGQNEFTDNGVNPDSGYYYKIIAVNDLNKTDTASVAAMSESEVVGPVVPVAQWFNSRRWNLLIWTLVVSGAILFFIYQAKAGKELYIRKIAGIDAVDDAIGRATEMGRKVYFVPGIQDIDDVATIAAITILGRVARICAQSDTKLDVPVSKSLVMMTAKEAVREAYSKAGRPDAFNEDQVHYVTDDQFGYAAAIDGMVMRDKPATMFYLGGFFAESLVLAETGNNAGAIQIAGTNQPAQIPFFIAACDYTLIGEELFAASAYLEREPRLLGSLKGQDFAKGFFLAVIFLLLIVAIFDLNLASRWADILLKVS